MEYKELSAELRSALKARGITYKDIANDMGMSESGVKKLLTAKDISFNKLEDILKIANIDLNTLLGVTGKNRGYVMLTKEQENFLSANLNHYNFLVQLQHFEMDLKSLKKANPKLSQIKINKCLNDLEKQGLINRDGTMVHSALAKGFRYGEKLGDAISKNLNKTLFEKFQMAKPVKKDKSSFWGIGHFSLSHKSQMDLRTALKGLLDEFSQRSERESKIYTKKDIVDVGLLLASMPMAYKELYPIE